MLLGRPLFSLLVSLLVSLPAWAGGDKKTFEKWMLRRADNIEAGVETAADFIDITLAGRKYTKKANESSLRITQYLNLAENGQRRFATDFNLNLRLPNLEKRWQLRFTSYDEEEESRDMMQQRVRTRPREREFGAGLFFFERLGRIKTSFLPRLILKDPLDVSYILRFETEANTSWVRVLPRVDLFADPQKGTGEYASLLFISDLTKRLELSVNNSEEYREKENFFTTQHSISLDYAATQRDGIGTSVSCVSINHPSFHLSEYTFSFSYARVLYVNRLRYSHTPYINFHENYRFKGHVGLNMNLELTF